MIGSGGVDIKFNDVTFERFSFVVSSLTSSLTDVDSSIETLQNNKKVVRLLPMICE